MKLSEVGQEYIDHYTAKHGRMPPDLADEPPLARMESTYLAAFGDLRTCRTIAVGMGGEVYGPIPWTAIDTYGRSFLGFEGTDLASFIRMIRELDQEWLEQTAKRAAREAQSAPKPRSKPPSGKRG